MMKSNGFHLLCQVIRQSHHKQVIHVCSKWHEFIPKKTWGCFKVLNSFHSMVLEHIFPTVCMNQRFLGVFHHKHKHGQPQALKRTAKTCRFS